MARHKVIVGNIGTVTHKGTYEESKECFYEYKRQSETNYGRAAGESVTWFRDNEIYLEFIGRRDKYAD